MKTIVVGVTGGIAAYKTCYLVSNLKKKGYDVRVVMTPAATEFVNPLTFQSLSHNPVEIDMFSPPRQWDVKHISLAQRADLVVVAPCTANFLGKVACGIADNLLSTVVMATKAPVLLVPAMNCNMYNNSIVQENMEKLKKFGYFLMDADSGYLACGDEGKGRMPEPEKIADEIEFILTPKTLSGKKVLVTAGPTREYWDSVRFLSNPSSGRMGFLLAEEAAKRGAKVSLISGPTNLNPPLNVKLIKIESTLEMYREVLKIYSDMDIVVKAAAVADYRPANRYSGKIKKRQLKDDSPEIKLERNPDILMELGSKKDRQILVGFAAEVEDLIENGEKKLKEKNLDLIVANRIGKKETGFSSLTNKAILIGKEGKEELPLLSKKELAVIIFNKIEKLLV